MSDGIRKAFQVRNQCGLLIKVTYICGNMGVDSINESHITLLLNFENHEHYYRLYGLKGMAAWALLPANLRVQPIKSCAD